MMARFSKLSQVGRVYRQSGDTIVEVMASITVLGLALGAAYGLSNRSFNTAIHTHDRIEALSLAAGQIEFLKDRGLKDTIGTLPSGQFCFNDSNGSTMGVSSCRAYRGSIYDIAISYCDGSGGCGSANVFTVRATWVAGGSGDQKQLTLFYKPPS